MARRIFVWLHRWTGLLLAGFLILEGLTGSILAFRSDLDRLISPQFYAAPRPGAAQLDLATLAERAEALIRPQAGVGYFTLGADQFVARVHPLNDPSTGKLYNTDFKWLILDPWTGEELGRRSREGDPSQGLVNLMPFIFELHRSLTLAAPGALALGVVSFIWTLDCFVGFYLTLPVAIAGFWRRWRPSWLVKWPAGFFRLNFDLHRASGLWLWPMLFVFAWSSVMLDLIPVYDWVTGAVFDYPSPFDEWMSMPPHPADQPPKLDWRAAQTIGERLMAEQEALHGFSFERATSMAYIQVFGVYNYGGRSSLDIGGGDNTFVSFDGDSGAFRMLSLPTGQHSGATVSQWFRALHFGDVFGSLAYRIFVCVLGLVIAMLSVTGVYIWWKKRQARQFSKAHRGVAGEAQAMGVSAE